MGLVTSARIAKSARFLVVIMGCGVRRGSSSGYSESKKGFSCSGSANIQTPFTLFSAKQVMSVPISSSRFRLSALALFGDFPSCAEFFIRKPQRTTAKSSKEYHFCYHRLAADCRQGAGPGKKIDQPPPYRSKRLATLVFLRIVARAASGYKCQATLRMSFSLIRSQPPCSRTPFIQKGRPAAGPQRARRLSALNFLPMRNLRR